MNRIQKKIISDAIDLPEILSDSEYDFVNDLAEKDDDYQLSQKQNSWLNSIGTRIAEQ